MKNYDELKNILEGVSTSKELQKFVKQLQIMSYNNRSDKKVLELVILTIGRSEQVGDKISLIDLISLKIIHLQHLKENLPIITELAETIHDLSKEINHIYGLALYYAHKWYIEKFKGNKIEAISAIEESHLIINKPGNHDEFIYHICNYTYAMEQWFEKRDLRSALVFHKCFDYFFQKELYHGLSMCLGALIIIYQQTQNEEKSMIIIKKILMDHNFLSKISTEIKSIIHYFIGLGHKLSFNLTEARGHIVKANTFLKSKFENSIYAQYYVNSFSRLAEIMALQGNLEGSLKKVREMERLLEKKEISNRLDNFTKNEVEHTFNLVKFYIQSRLLGFNVNKIQVLKEIILKNICKRSNNVILLAEFVLNSKLSSEQLFKLQKTENASVNRIRNIIDYLIIKNNPNIVNSEDCLKLKIKTLKDKSRRTRNFIEKAFIDLLIAQELFDAERFSDIFPLLRKYKNKLNRIEILEMRVFMEAFIQVGAFKSGDPLGPALQYMAIKKCRNYSFSRLENKLLNYLDMQKRDIQSLTL